MHRQRESLYQYQTIVYFSPVTAWLHGSRLSTKFVDMSNGMGESLRIPTFSFFQNTEVNTVTVVNLIDIIGILSGYIEAKTHPIPGHSAG